MTDDHQTARAVDAAHLEGIYRDMASTELDRATCDCGGPLFAYAGYPGPLDDTEMRCALRGLAANPGAADAPVYLWVWHDTGRSAERQPLVAAGYLPLDATCEAWSLREPARIGTGPLTDMLALVQETAGHLCGKGDHGD